ncbi:homocysteine methyltransferase [Coraliomargarita sinensis]|uniref:Homocysteine methyltransferase n=1 Tax=Coraliomargarita sinensis TaxID=2174842 RepID=A0A317ZP08_9BACT|nr:homocysteine S-methyltransferase family protein [Coraliomargarita sinensis]PXA05081.1 homocysteine methyltransferase [Coraliomargarita sinensis]
MLIGLFEKHPKILIECAIAERLRRMPEVELHPTLFNTPLIYGPEAACESMTALYREYIDTAAEADLPLLLTAPTWRLDPARIATADVPAGINSDAVNYLIGVRDDHAGASPVMVGALTGPRGDCYRPEEAPDTDTAERFHSTQIGELAYTAADFLLAQTLPAVKEALGIAKAMAKTDKPYFISFCTGTDGKVLDGTSLSEAMTGIDRAVPRPPLGYFVNCTHPGFITPNYPPGSLERLVGIQANGSSKDVTRLDASSETQADPVVDWAQAMSELHTTHNVSVLGGCCGTGLAHLKSLAQI